MSFQTWPRATILECIVLAHIISPKSVASDYLGDEAQFVTLKQFRDSFGVNERESSVSVTGAKIIAASVGKENGPTGLAIIIPLTH